MRTSVLAGLFACAVIFGLSSSQAEASTPVDVLEIHQSATAVDTLLAVAEPVADKIAEIPEPAEPATPKVITHVITDNESLSSIAKQYDVEWQRIFDKNVELENPNIINPGDEIVIPDDDEELETRTFTTPEPVVRSVQAKSTPAPAVNSAPQPRPAASAGNGYVAGYCTWYVKNMRPDLPNNLGNAVTWVNRAAAQGIPTGSTPQVGAAAQRGNHVAYVEAVNGDGTIIISDMNYRALYQVTTRTVPASEWNYIY